MLIGVSVNHTFLNLIPSFKSRNTGSAKIRTGYKKKIAGSLNGTPAIG